jgi:hypothetical protein
MKEFIGLLLVLALALSGCVTKSNAKAQARAAFIAGQQQALSQQVQRQTPTVLIRGEVKNQVIPWTEGLTLVNAILAAEYQGTRDPRQIVITRHGEAVRIDPRLLLRGEDRPLEAGDIVDIVR